MGTRREKILQKLNPKLLKMTPKLSGGAGSFIDLDSNNSLEDGAKNLMMRFLRNQDLCEKNKRNLMQNLTELTVSSVRHNENNEICEVISERLMLPFVRNDEAYASCRPGERLQKLKMELKEKMSAKWEEEYKKRVSEKKAYSESKLKQKKCSDYEDECEDDEIDGLLDNDSNNEKISGAECDVGKDVAEEVEEENSDDKFGDNEEVNSDDEFGDDEEESDAASVSSDEQNNDDNCKENKSNEPEDEYQLSDACSWVPAYQPGGGMLYGGSELTQCDEGLPQNLFSPSLRLSMVDSSGSKPSTEGSIEATPKKPRGGPNEEINNSFIGKNKPFSEVQNNSFDLNEAFEFCSGKFPDADKSESKSDTEDPPEENSQDSENGGKDKSQNSFEEDLSENSQSDDVDNEKETSKTRKNIIAFADSEAEEEPEIDDNINLSDSEELPSTGTKLLSDNEDEDEVVDEEVKRKKKRRQNLHFSDEEDATTNCEEEKENDDDSDVNEKEDEDDEQRSVYYDSEENEIINPKEFFEKEAELSGSEWSGDEDERGLNEFDAEEGDADKLDDEQVRSQLGKIHIRRMLDDDAREVRLLQEILFEDGDLHSDGKKRERKFKWKNIGKMFVEQGNEGESKEDGGNSSEDDSAEEQQLWRIRHEKELFLMSKKKDGDLSSDEEIVKDFHPIKVTSVKTSAKLSSSNEDAVENAKIVPDYTKIMSSTGISQNVRGSFLRRNEEFLSRLAKATSGVNDNVLGTKSSKNFVFATKSPEKKNPPKCTVRKRQMEDAGSCSGRDKRIKILPPEIDTGPSILDFLV